MPVAKKHTILNSTCVIILVLALSVLLGYRT